MLTEPTLDVNVANQAGVTPLVGAVNSNNIEIAKLLAADPRTAMDYLDSVNHTAFSSACVQNFADIARVLLPRCGDQVNMFIRAATPEDQRVFHCTTLLIGIVQCGFNDILNILLSVPQLDVNAKTTEGMSALECVVYHGTDEILGTLLSDTRLDVNMVCGQGTTALIHAVKTQQYKAVPHLLMHKSIDVNAGAPILSAVICDEYAIVEQLLRHPKIDTNCRDEQSNGLLVNAACRGLTHMVRLLVQHPGMDINLRNSDGITPLSAALSAKVKRCEGDSVFNVDACERTDSCWLMMQHPQCDVNAVDFVNSHSVLSVAVMARNAFAVWLLLRDPRLQVNAQTGPNKSTALILACELSVDISIVRLLLKRPDLDLNVRNTQHLTAIHCAIANKNVQLTALLAADPRTDLSITLGMEMTLLMIALSMDIELVKALLQSGNITREQFDARSSGGDTVLTFAKRLRNTALVQLLEDYEKVFQARDRRL
jgi:ankyrin repeat protein